MFIDGLVQLTPARANLFGRDMGVFVYDPLWDDYLSMMRLSFVFSAYGGSGADGFSFHLAHRSHTADWITGPDYKPYEELAVPTGLSIQVTITIINLMLQFNGLIIQSFIIID